MEKDKDRNLNSRKSGLDVNYLVRSKLCKVPRCLKRNSQTCIKQLEMLKEVELLQNIQVQKSLKSLMNQLSIDKRNTVGQLHNAKEFQKTLKKEKCHNNVVRFRKATLSTKAPTSMSKETRPSSISTKSLSGSNDVNSFNRKTPVRQKLYYVKSKCDQTTNVIQKVKDDERVTGKKKYKLGEVDQIPLPSIIQKEHPSSCLIPEDMKALLCSTANYLTLPIIDNRFIPKASQFKYCLPVLDTRSKFAIIRKARLLRQERFAAKQQPKEKVEPSRKQPISEEKFEIFADNYELLSPRYLTSRGDDKESMEFLDKETFADIDCDDFLHLKNRALNISPAPAIVKYPTQRTALTKLELRKGFR